MTNKKTALFFSQSYDDGEDVGDELVSGDLDHLLAETFGPGSRAKRPGRNRRLLLAFWKGWSGIFDGA